MTKITLVFALLLTAAHSNADIRCPRFNDTNRDAALQELFTKIKPDPMNERTILKQDAIFNCLEVLITASRSKLGGKSPSLENMKTLVLWATKAAQYKNDEDSSDYLAGLGKELFQPNRKITLQALQVLRGENAISSSDEAVFRETTNVTP